VLSGIATRYGAVNSTPVVRYDYTYTTSWRRGSAKQSGKAKKGQALLLPYVANLTHPLAAPVGKR